MRRLDSVRSSIQVMTASWPLRSHERSPERNRFFASCWLMVEAPATTLPRCSFFAIAFWIASQSKPSWSRNLRVLGGDHRALQVRRDALVGHPLLAQRGFGFFARSASRRRSMNAVDAGLYARPVEDVAEEPELHARRRRGPARPACSRSAFHSDDQRRAQAAPSAPRSFRSTGAVSGRTPRQTKNDSAACSTSMPRPSQARAPARARRGEERRVAAVDHVVGERAAAAGRRPAAAAPRPPGRRRWR